MYLVTIRKICEHCDDKPIPIPDIAEGLDVQPVSVNQMVKKLAEAGLVVYTPYKGVELTPEGRSISMKILRHRRLWEIFLVKDLKMGLDEADDTACQLEHITTRDLANRLSEFLDNPTVCFHGDPIYPDSDESQAQPSVKLNAMKVGQLFQIVRLEGDESLRLFLADMGIFSGNRGKIIATNGTGNLLVETNLGESVTVTREIAENIFVEEHYV
jgi:DtxR family Mn-dependent transcriptional regulator